MNEDRRSWSEIEIELFLNLYEKYKDHACQREIIALIYADFKNKGIPRSYGSIRNCYYKHKSGRLIMPLAEWSQEEMALVEELKDKYESKFVSSNKLARKIADELNLKGYKRNIVAIKAFIRDSTNSKIYSRPWSQADVELVHWFHQKGYSVKEISKELKRRQADVEEMLKRKPMSKVSDLAIYYKSPVSARTLK